jgi:tRNA-2-methylthio-N6-dimethylallyladenosine synthase
VIVDEARGLAEQGVKEITLLGQTVNSYKYREPRGQTARLSDLLERLDAIAGLERIKFITNFPNDMSDDLLQAVRDLPKVARYLHVPAQSGCDEVLARMKRLYTVGLYDEMLQRIRETIPDAAVSSDFIVGFCGETEASFERSVRLVERARFKNSFIFKYSARQGTKADTLFIDDVPEEVKKRRNNDLLAVQTAISQEDNRRFLGRTVDVLVEGPSKSAAKHEAQAEFGQLTGRTTCDRIVVFDGHERLVGRTVPVSVEDATAVTLFGRVVTAELVAPGA